MRTKSQKICAGFLGLAVAAFVVDRWVIGFDDPATPATARAPRPAPSPATAPPLAQPATLSGTSAASPAPQAAGPTLASRLSAIAEVRGLSRGSVGDAFRPSEAWLALAAPPPAPEPQAPVAQAVAPRRIDHAALFKQRHTLTAVMKNGRAGLAIVNGRLYEVGQYVGGFKLTEVGLTEAKFWGKGTRVTLKLAGQLPAVADVR